MNLLTIKLFFLLNYRFKSNYNDKPVQYIIEVRLGEFLNIVCPQIGLNDQGFDEYHTLYKVLIFILVKFKKETLIKFF